MTTSIWVSLHRPSLSGQNCAAIAQCRRLRCLTTQIERFSDASKGLSITLINYRTRLLASIPNLSKGTNATPWAYLPTY